MGKYVSMKPHLSLSLHAYLIRYASYTRRAGLLYATYASVLQLNAYGSIIHERTISLRFLVVIMRVLRLEVSVYDVCITNKSNFKPLLLKGNSKKENS
jgi:hypothetical protein